MKGTRRKESRPIVSAIIPVTRDTPEILEVEPSIARIPSSVRVVRRSSARRETAQHGSRFSAKPKDALSDASSAYRLDSISARLPRLPAPPDTLPGGSWGMREGGEGEAVPGPPRSVSNTRCSRDIPEIYHRRRWQASRSLPAIDLTALLLMTRRSRGSCRGIAESPLNRNRL